MVAAGKGRDEEAMVLLANGADPRLCARDGSSAADWADRCPSFTSIIPFRLILS